METQEQKPAGGSKKICRKCNQDRSISEFAKDSKKSDGCGIYCRNCRSKLASDYYIRNKDKVNARHKAYRDSNLDHVKAIEKTSKKRHAGRVKQARQNRAAIINSQPGHETIHKHLVHERDSWCCYLCGNMTNQDTAVIDHVVPISRGGVHNYSNVRTAHRECNYRKRTYLIAELDPEEWPGLANMKPVGRPFSPKHDPDAMPDEEWIPLPGRKGYKISNYGRLQSLVRLGQDGDYRMRKPSIKHGYVVYGMPRISGKGKNPTQWVGAHILVLTAFVGPRPGPSSIYEGRHLDNVRRNNYVGNLAWGTKAENGADMRRHGTAARGSRSNRTDLTEPQVIEICKMLIDGVTNGLVSKTFGITPRVVSAIKYGCSWSWLTGASRANPVQPGFDVTCWPQIS